MTRNPSFAKFFSVGIVLALLFIGAWATTHGPRTAAKGKITSDNSKNNVTAKRLNTGKAGIAVPQPFAAFDQVFEIDGNAIDDSGPGLPEDWNTLIQVTTEPTNPKFITGPAGSATVRTYISDPPTRDDLIYTGGGSKDFNEITDWGQVARGTGPDKDDVEHAYAARYVESVSGDQIIVFGGDRPTNNGDSNIGFWFFQNAVTPNASGGFNGVHKNGDVFVLSAFSGGGGTSTIRVLVWVGTPTGIAGDTAVTRCAAFGAGSFIDPKSDTTAFPAGTLCDVTGSKPDLGRGVTNGPVGTSIGVSWPYVNKDNKTSCTPNLASNPQVLCQIPSPDFFEGAIDLNQIGGGISAECFASFLLETRSSDSVSAVLKDFALGAFQPCSSSCIKTANPIEECENPANPGFGAPVDITFEASNTGGGALTVTMKDDNGTPNNTSDDFYITGGLTSSGAAGTCTTGTSPTNITLAINETKRCKISKTLPVGVTTDTLTVHTVVPSSGVADCKKTATVTVNPNPTVSINSISGCLLDGTAAFTLMSTAGGGTSPFTFSWSSGETTQNITKGPGSYTVTVTDAKGCTAAATRRLGLCSD